MFTIRSVGASRGDARVPQIDLPIVTHAIPSETKNTCQNYKNCHIEEHRKSFPSGRRPGSTGSVYYFCGEAIFLGTIKLVLALQVECC